MQFPISKLVSAFLIRKTKNMLKNVIVGDCEFVMPLWCLLVPIHKKNPVFISQVDYTCTTLTSTELKKLIG